MTVSELAHLTLLDPPANLGPFTAAARDALPIQDQWLRQNNSTTTSATTGGGNDSSDPAGAQNRGAAFFQQIEDPTQILITAHWASTAEHETWMASADNAAALGALARFLDLAKTTLFHIADAELFPAKVIKTCATTEDSSSYETKGLVSIRRFVVAEDKKKAFEAAFRSELKVDGERGGWRIEDDPEQPGGTAQYLAVSLTKQQAVKGETSSAADKVEGLVLNASTRHYRRVC